MDYMKIWLQSIFFSSLHKEKLLFNNENVIIKLNLANEAQSAILAQIWD